MNTHSFDSFSAVNTDQLQEELQCVQVYVDSDCLVIVGNLTKEAAQKGLDLHVPNKSDNAGKTAAQAKLAALGLTTDDSKALGL